METSLDPRAGDKKLARASTANDDVLTDGVHILTAVLLVTALLSSVRLPFGPAALNLLLCSGFAVLYFFGSAQLSQWRESIRLLWLIGLTVIWILAMLVAPVGIYLVFSLFFLYLRVMDGISGIVSVVFATAVAVVTQIPTGLTVGGVMGPAVSAAVVLAIHYAFQTLSRINQERELLIEQLLATRTQLAETEHAAGVAHERQRLAHEIHDTVAQGLSSIQMLLHSVERDLSGLGVSDEKLANPHRLLYLARTTAADNLSETRAMIATLQPSSLSESSLNSALERMATGFAAAGGMEITVDVEGEVRQLPMRTEAALLRISQGAVGNVAKHAGATRCRVTVTYEPEEVRLDVVDDGRGFDPAELSTRPTSLGHIGLDAMRQRCAEQGGVLEVESTPGAGTAVSVAIPIATVQPDALSEQTAAATTLKDHTITGRD
ncbi:sensor histidine kinase [Corynebacterium alimapuense]|uniref:Sensor histidine kinase n=1 Tax=Corynebacterium alimapuense TaxID=1576874 RepID=A0A3M8KA47_9CORY|nr:sensor histidine kinase [Corynebacterium alimapuense]RNE50040.1 sensor histidine kinase [Corynebacterium alimapuense]